MFVVVGSARADLYDVNVGDPEAGYFATWMGANARPWVAAEEWLEFLPEIAPFLPEGCADALEAELESSPDNRLYVGPGLLAGGTLKNNKENTPEKVGYLLTIPECEGMEE